MQIPSVFKYSLLHEGSWYKITIWEKVGKMPKLNISSKFKPLSKGRTLSQKPVMVPEDKINWQPNEHRRLEQRNAGS